MEAESSAPTRASGRVRNKSARAIESESTERLLSAAKTAQKEKVDGETATEESKDVSKTKRKVSGKRKPRASKYCVCHEDKKGPMIECGECLNWYHFGCVGMTEEEAERIHNYVCSQCAEKTGKTSTYIYDVNSFPSPAPPSDVEIENGETSKPIPKKGKARRPPKAKSTPKSKAEKEDDASVHSESEHSDSESPESEAAPTDEEEEEGHEQLPQRKRARSSSLKATAKAQKPPTKRPSVSERKPSASQRKASIADGALPPARQYVLDKMATVIRNIFGEEAMDKTKAESYGREVEATLFAHLKDIVQGKETAGGRYKAQFNLINSSLSKELRPDLKSDIVEGKLTPAEVALLTSEDLATAEQLAEIQAARDESLRQQKRIKEKADSVRVGRDGFEEVEDKEDREARQHRKEEEEKPSEPEPFPTPTRQPVAVEASKSPVSESGTAEPTSPGRRRSSVNVSASPAAQRPSVSLNSAWGGKTAPQHDEDMEIEEDQDKIDLSDIVPEDVEYGDGLDDVQAPDIAEKSDPWTELLSKPVGWSGGITNPADESPHTPPVQLRQVAGRALQPNSYWSHLLPKPVIGITGRVPTAKSLQYLSDRRLDRTKELVVISLTLSPDATEDQRKTWSQIIDFHISRDRHAIFHPYDKPPPTAARELYLVPLRPEDPTPELFDLIDNYSLPREGRTEPVFIGVFVANRDVAPSQSPADRERPKQAIARPPPASFPPPPAAGAAAAAPPNAQLQALMASLDANAIAGLLKPGASPLAGVSPVAPIPGASPIPGLHGPPGPPPGALPMPPFPPGGMGMPLPPPGIGRPRPEYGAYPPAPPRGYDRGGYSPAGQDRGGYSPHDRDGRDGRNGRDSRGYDGRWEGRGGGRGGGRWGR